MKRFLSLVLFLMFVSGCATHGRVADAKHPDVVITNRGQLEFRGERIDADDLPDALDDAGYDKSATINIRIPADTSDYRLPYYVMGVLAKEGFRRPVLVKERRAYSVTGAGARAAAIPGDRTVNGLLKKQAAPKGRVVYPR